MKTAPLASLIAALVVLHLALIQPNHPYALRPALLLFFPLELPALIALLLLLPPRAWRTQLVRAVLVAVLMTIGLLKLGDFGTSIAYARPFILTVDHHLVGAGWNLLSDSTGIVPAVALVSAAALALGAVGYGLWWATGRLSSEVVPPRARLPLTGVAVVFASIAIADIGHKIGHWSLPFRPAAATAFTGRVGVEHVLRNATTLRGLAEFREAAAEDPFAGRDGLLADLGDNDLVIVFVESYGRSSFDNPLYAGTHPFTLREIEARLDAAGLAMRSGWLEAPVIGGQSWLAHASKSSGLWVNHQGLYQALLASERRTLFHLAQAAGRRTVAIKPAHVFLWPEGDFFGFDAIYNAADLGYAGRRFNWATMPDQFTLAAFDRLERLQEDRAPLVAQIALVSSHAPFLPVPPVIDWDEIGDGTIFNRWADDGDPPEVVWRDADRVREKFRLAIDYSLRVVGSYAERIAEDGVLLFVLGDHEVAPFIAGVDGADVPVHVIGPAALVDRFADWGWTAGLIPDGATPTLRMDAVRDRLLQTFSTEAFTASSL